MCDCRWPCLRECAFGGVKCSENLLAKFFEVHTDTLEIISLCHLELTRGNWISLFRTFHSTCSLKHATIAGSLYDGEEEEEEEEEVEQEKGPCYVDENNDGIT